MRALEKKQPTYGQPTVGGGHEEGRTSRQAALDDQIVIYEARIRDDFSGSPNRIGLSMLGLLLTSGLVANQIRHHGAGPVWPSAESGWLDFELKLWDPSTRILVSVGLITFSFVKSLKFLFTLTHTIKRITIKKQDLRQLQQLIATSRKRKKAGRMRGPSVGLTMYPVGAVSLVGPVRKLFGFSVLESVPLGEMVRLSSPIAGQTLPHDRRSLWLKFCDPSSSDPPLLDSSPTTPLLPSHLNSFALQIPAVGRWGNSSFNLSPSDILSLFEERIQSIHEPTSHGQGSTSPVDGGREAPIEDADDVRRLFFGLDFRHSVGFNLAVLRALLAARYRRLVGSTSA